MIKKAKDEFSKDKIKWLIVAAIVGLLIKDCGGYILQSGRDSALNYMNMPQAVQHLQKDVKKIKKRLRMD